MARDIQIFGEFLVRVRGEPNSDIGKLSDLGLTVGGDRPCVIRPIFKHKDVNTDDFGPEVPPELITQLVEVRLSMTLAFYDEVILDACYAESQGGGVAGIMVPAGTPMGGGVPVLTAGNHYITVNLVNGDSVAPPVPGVVPLPGLPGLTNLPWRFFTCVLSGDGASELPLGTKRSELFLQWRIIPYVFPPAQQRQLVTVTTPGQLLDARDQGIITPDQFAAYVALIAAQGFAVVAIGPLLSTFGEITSGGAQLWDSQLQT